MTIEVAVVISAVSVAFGIYTGIANLKRANATDTAKDAAQLTTVIVKLENIGIGVSEIKNELGNMKDDIQGLRERMVVIEQSTKSAHKRIDEHTGTTRREDGAK